MAHRPVAEVFVEVQGGLICAIDREANLLCAAHPALVLSECDQRLGDALTAQVRLDVDVRDFPDRDGRVENEVGRAKVQMPAS